MSSLTIRPAALHEQDDALALSFAHRSVADRAERIAAARELIARRELDPAGILAAFRGGRIVGAAIAATLPGGAAVLDPPAASDDETAGRLVAHALDWLARSGAKLVQCLLPSEELARADALLGGGFKHITSLVYLRHDLDLPAAMLGAPERLAFVRFDRSDEATFAAILGRTYRGSADCPELSAVRTAAESLAGHRGPGFNPATWWLALKHQEPLGVLLINSGDDGGWDLAYLGVMPEARRRGIGRELVCKALVEAKLAEQPFVSLAVDLRNAAARELYRQVGFEPYDRREFLLIALPCAGAPGRG